MQQFDIYSYLGKRIKENCPKVCGKFAGKGICKNLFLKQYKRDWIYDEEEYYDNKTLKYRGIVQNHNIIQDNQKYTSIQHNTTTTTTKKAIQNVEESKGRRTMGSAKIFGIK